MTRAAEPRLATAAERLTQVAGLLGSWIYPALVLLVITNVSLRYVFASSWIELEELQWYLNAIAFFLCVAYAYKHDAHVRITIFRDRMSATARAWVELLGVLLLLLPFCAIVGTNAWSYFARSWALQEGSINPAGLPALYVVKLFMASAFVLLVVQGLAAALHSLATIRHGSRPDGR